MFFVAAFSWPALGGLSELISLCHPQQFSAALCDLLMADGYPGHGGVPVAEYLEPGTH
jgi:hypothetical protein